MSISKVNSTTSIIRKSDYSRKDIDSVSEVEISNKDSKLDNNFFKDILIAKQDKKKKEKKKEEDTKQKKDSDPSITDFYV